MKVEVGDKFSCCVFFVIETAGGAAAESPESPKLTVAA